MEPSPGNKTTGIKNSQTAAGSIQEPFDYLLYAHQDPDMNALTMPDKKIISSFKCEVKV
jgi:hypothetical protein